MKKGLKTFLKVIGILVAIFIVLGITLQVAGNKYIEPIIAKQLERVVKNGSDSLYRFHYSDMEVNIWTGSISIKDMHIYTDSTRFYQLKNNNQLPPVTLNINIGEGKIKGFGIWKFLTSKEVNVSKILTKDADVTLYRHFQNNKPKTVTNSVPLWKLLRPDINKIYVEEIVFDNIKMSYHNQDSGTAFRWKFEEFDTKLSDLLIDSASSMDKNRLLYTGNIETQIRKITLYSADSLYQINVGKFTYSLKNRMAEIDSFSLSPSLAKKEFYAKTGMEKDIYTLDMPSIKLLHFSPELFLSENTLSADTLLLNDAKIDIYHDRVPLDDTTSKLGKFPHQMLLKAPFFVRIHTALGNNISVSYTEKDSKTLREGSLTFNNIEGEASHISNHPDDIALHPALEIKVGGIFMKNTTIKGSFSLDLTTLDGIFKAEANIGPTDVTVLNPVTEALASATFKSLKTGPTLFKIHGNEKEAFGYLEMPYTDLQLQILNIPEAGKGATGKKLETLAIKLFAHNENPKKGEELRIASNVKEIRNKNRSFFNLIWKTLFVTAKDVAMKESAKKIVKKRQEKGK